MKIFAECYFLTDLVLLGGAIAAGRASAQQASKKEKQNDLRPTVCVAHVVLETDRMKPSAQLFRAIGMGRRK